MPTDRELKTKKVYREYIRNFFVLLVTKGSNESAVRRGYNTLMKVEKYHPAVKVIILTDEPYVSASSTSVAVLSPLTFFSNAADLP